MPLAWGRLLRSGWLCSSACAVIHDWAVEPSPLNPGTKTHNANKDWNVPVRELHAPPCGVMSAGTALACG